MLPVDQSKFRSIPKAVSIAIFLAALILLLLNTQRLIALLVPVFIALFLLWMLFIGRAWELMFAIDRKLSGQGEAEYVAPSMLWPNSIRFILILVAFAFVALLPALPLAVIGERLSEMPDHSAGYTITLVFTAIPAWFLNVVEPAVRKVFCE